MSFSAPVIPTLVSPPLQTSASPALVFGPSGTATTTATTTVTASSSSSATATSVVVPAVSASSTQSTPRLAVTMKSTPPPETPAAASINTEMRDLTGYSALSKDLKHHVSASSYEEAESIAEMQVG